MTSLHILLEARSAARRCWRAYEIEVGADLFSAAAVVGEFRAPVRGSSGKVATVGAGVGFIPTFCRHDATKAGSRE